MQYIDVQLALQYNYSNSFIVIHLPDLAFNIYYNSVILQLVTISLCRATWRISQLQALSLQTGGIRSHQAWLFLVTMLNLCSQH